MTLIVVFVALLMLRILKLDAASSRHQWPVSYCGFIYRHCENNLSKNGLLGTLLLLLPLVLAMVVLLTLVYHTVGVIGYYILNCIVLWFCMNSSDGSSEWCGVAQLHGVFGVIFWFLLMGPLGALIYYATHMFTMYIQDNTLGQKTDKGVAVLRYWLDWLPARLLGLSVALVSSFLTVIPLWLRDLAAPVADTSECLIGWCEKAIERAVLETGQYEKVAMSSLLDRALCLWLAVLLLINIGMWVG